MSGMAPPPPPRGRHLTARDALYVVGIVFLALVILTGRSVRHAGKEMSSGWERTMVLAVGEPAGWIADRLPLQNLVADATRPLKSGDDLSSGPGGFDENGTAAANTGVPPVTPDAFDPVALGQKAVPPARPLQTVLVTGDSMSLILDAEIARRFAGTSVKTVRDPHVGTGLSITGIVDWGKLSVAQVRKDKPDAIVVFIGANEGFPFEKQGGGEIKCCGVDWATEYANRIRAMMNTYRAKGAAQVYWVKLMTPRSKARADIGRVVNAAIDVAAEPWKTQVHLIDTIPIFTPKGYRDAMPINGEDTIVRMPDGIHLNDTGAAFLANVVIKRMGQDFALRR
jgi:hypothetical protein